jgi:hypothetical protein
MSIQDSIRVNLKPQEARETTPLRSRKILDSEKSRFNVGHTAINLQRKPFVECPQEPPMRATLNTDGLGCVARSLNKDATKRHRNTD